MELPDVRKKGRKKKEQRAARKFNWLTPIAHVVNKLAAPNFANSEETGPSGVPAQHPSPRGPKSAEFCQGLRGLADSWGIGNPTSKHNYSRPTKTPEITAHILFIEGLGFAGGHIEPVEAELQHPQGLLCRLLCKRRFNSFPWYWPRCTVRVGVGV